MALFNTILIANRGEIACRIIRTAKKLNIKTIAIFSEVDSKALHVKLADEAYLVGPASSKESYLNIGKILQIAKLSKANAIHPGYGFLSENYLFAKACENENITFIGPSSTAIQIMANKNVAKDLMQKHEVPVLPGYFDVEQTKENLLTAAKTIGYPILLKAVAGGGGKGLRLVHNEEDFTNAYLATKREAAAFFNDDKILLEKYLLNARHVEVQILADHYGHVQTLFTRDCSIQRRHQKIIEEAPAPNLDAGLNENMMQAAVRAAQTIQYANAGTIEFLLTDEAFYFMEMNTRLQVEHPVTEMITGLDLVEWQLRIAAGEKLFQQEAQYQGHAIEVRLNAEDPNKDFLPSAGKLHYFDVPKELPQVRIDTGYQAGDSIGIYYDSLLAKLIVWDETRALALQRMQQLLSKTIIFGINSNLGLLKAICENEHFIQGDFSTRFLQEHSFNISKQPDNYVLTIAALFLFLLTQENAYAPWSVHDGWQLFGNRPLTFQFSILNTKIPVHLKLEKPNYFIQVHNLSLTCHVLNFVSIEKNIYRLELIIDEEYKQAIIYQDNLKLEIVIGKDNYNLEVTDDSMKAILHETDEQLLAPMPGTIVALHVNSGQKVAKGDKLLVIEAMKMEHTLYAPRNGVIKQCYYQIGDLIKEGSELIEFEA